MTNIYDYINKSNWHDFYLDSININYDKIVVSIMMTEKVQIVCKNFVGIKYFGQWDECVIEDINIVDKGNIIDENKKIVAQNNPINFSGGGVKNYTSAWYDVIIKLIDGVSIHIVCMDVKIEM